MIGIHAMDTHRNTNLNAGGKPATQERDAILRSRALALAEPPVSETESSGFEVLEFRLANESFGIESSHVREVYPLKEFTPLPGTPPFVLGITSVRGKIFSIFDLRVFLGMPAQGGASTSQVIIVQSGDMEVAIPVNEIVGVCSLRSQEVRPTLPALTGESAAYLQGVTGERLVLLDVVKLLGDPRIIVNEGEK